MKSHVDGKLRFAGFLFLSRMQLSRLWIAAIASGWLLLPLAPSAAREVPATPQAHVFLIRGVLNIFSLGMDEMAAKLRRQGIYATVHNHLFWASIADDAAAEYKSGRIKTIILVGHSSGATCLPDIVERLSRQGVPVKLAIGLDSVFHTSLSGRVGRYINYYVANGAGTPVAKGRDLKGTLENVDVENVPGISHLTIDKNQLIQQKVIAEIDATVFHGPGERQVLRNPQILPIAAPLAPAARRSAAAN